MMMQLLLSSVAVSALGAVSVDFTPVDVVLLNPNAEADAGWTFTGNAERSNGELATGGGSLDAHTGADYFYGGPSTTASTIYQRVAIPASAESHVDTGTASYRLTWYQTSYAGSDNCQMILRSYAADNTALLGTSEGERIAPIGDWQEQFFVAEIPTGTRYVELEMNFIRGDGSALNSYIDTIQLKVGPPYRIVESKLAQSFGIIGATDAQTKSRTSQSFCVLRSEEHKTKARTAQTFAILET